LIRERQREGIALAKKMGKQIGAKKNYLLSRLRKLRNEYLKGSLRKPWLRNSRFPDRLFTHP
jgi:DNA invertase Pin-like site-specific DNA recombinase